jgi:hypothetical protein
MRRARRPGASIRDNAHAQRQRPIPGLIAPARPGVLYRPRRASFILLVGLILSCAAPFSRPLGLLTLTLAPGGVELARDARVPVLSNVPTVNSLFLTSAARITSHWLPDYHGKGGVWRLNVPFWIPLLLAAAGAIYFRRLAAAPAWACPRCRYDLSAMPRAEGGLRCPECGMLNPADVQESTR